MKNDLETAKIILTDDLKDSPYVKENLYGNAATRRKIENYIIESALLNVERAACIDWFVSLLTENGVRQKEIDSTRLKAELQFMIIERYLSK